MRESVRQHREWFMLRHKSETAMPSEVGDVDDPATIDRCLDRLRAAAADCGYAVTEVDGRTLCIRPPEVRMRWFRHERVPPALRLMGAKLNAEVTISFEQAGHALVCRWRQDVDQDAVAARLTIIVILAMIDLWWIALAGAFGVVDEWRNAGTTDAWVRSALVWCGPSRAT
jgi:hypothetical protein